MYEAGEHRGKSTTNQIRFEIELNKQMPFCLENFPEKQLLLLRVVENQMCAKQ